MNNENINIRLVNDKDRDRILEISKQIWEGTDYIPNIIDKWMNSDDGLLFVLEYNGKITHFERLNIQSKNDGWIEGLRGDPEYRGKGFAQKLGEYIIEYSKKIGLKTLRASTYFKNDASINLTKKLGFDIKYKFLFGEKKLNIDEIINEEQFKDIVLLNETDIDELLDFLENSKTFKEYGQFHTNGWHYEKHSKNVWLKVLKEQKLYGIKGGKKIISLLMIETHNNRQSGKVISYIDSDYETIKKLIKFAEFQVLSECKKIDVLEYVIEYAAPKDSEIVTIMENENYKLWEESDANVIIFERNID